MTIYLAFHLHLGLWFNWKPGNNPGFNKQFIQPINGFLYWDDMAACSKYSTQPKPWP